jgi:capsular exopolysaccharide synthesis family protein
MNHPDRPPGLMPPHTEIVPAAAAYELDLASADLPAAGKKITLGLVVRALRRHWWQAALIWLVGSVGLMALVYFKVKPTYLAFTRVRVEPANRALFGGSDGGNFSEFRETQVNVIGQPTVLEAALQAHPELLTFPRLAEADDKIAEIRSSLIVGVVKGTNLIEVSTSTESPMESAAIVNAVVDAYVRQALDLNSEETDQKVKQLDEARLAKEKEVADKRNAIKELQKAHGDIDVAGAKERNTVTVEEYRQLSNELLRVQIEIVKAEAQLAQLQADQPAAAAEAREIGQDELIRLFYSDKRVAAARERKDLAEDKFKTVKKKVRNLADPAVQRPMEDLKEAQADLDALWKEMKPQLEAWARKGIKEVGGGAVDNPLRGAEAQLAALKAQELSLTDKLNTLNIRKRAEGATAVSLEFDRMDLNRAEQYLDTISRNLADLKFTRNSPILRVRKEFLAKQSPRGTNNRLKVMAVAPVAMLFGVLCLMVFLELHAGRVVDPEELTARSRVPVVGVVPPLPQVRPQGALFSGRDEFKAQRQLDQFVQSLDHLRVALCSGRDSWGRDRRVILITSAVGSEGKTTLAAQLAERCVNAGLHTLLIDGDLRNPTLSRMLDVPNNRGLINVLRGECLPDEAISVVGGAGGFHFMPSGTPKVDPSRLLHGDRLGKFLAQAREGFDIVIVDAPPVLPVPDALTIGRWTDGAVLAVRCDTSRFNLVEKANRRLATVGVQVIGAVVNGVRVADSTYGSYYPSYASTDDRSAPLDV